MFHGSVLCANGRQGDRDREAKPMNVPTRMPSLAGLEWKPLCDFRTFVNYADFEEFRDLSRRNPPPLSNERVYSIGHILGALGCFYRDRLERFVIDFTDLSTALSPSKEFY